jgi:COP9 signalosome complex subunit 5
VLSEDAQMALQRFEMENEVIKEDELYFFDEDEADRLFKEKPWKKDEHHFRQVKISATALIKMVMHTKSGGDIEVMGMLQGKVKGDTFYVMDTFALPVEATETRVNAANDANEYMVSHIEDCEKVNRPENIVGWYHSHPGYGCWLSGIDVGTQSLYQRVQEPFLAIVVDPKRTMSAGKVEIGCFRTFSDAHVKKVEESMKSDGGGGHGAKSVPLEKIAELGAHYHKYYQLENTFYKS